MVVVSDLFDAISGCDLDRVREIAEANPGLVEERTEQGVSPVMLAAYHRRSDIVNVLLAADPNLDVVEAAILGRTDLVSAMIDGEPALVRSWSADGFTPLHFAAFFGHAALVGRLVSAGADVNVAATNPSAVRPINSGAASLSVDVVRALLEGGAAVDGTQHGGLTALHAAAHSGLLEMVDLLLHHGADPRLESTDGKSALDMAEEDGQEVVAERLRDEQRADN